MSTIPQELDWVAKRAACNAGRIFDDLCVGIRKDIEAINAVKKLNEHSQLGATMTMDGNTIVIGQPTRIPRVVVKVAIVEDNVILVGDGAKGVEWRVQVALNNEGRCTLRLQDGTELEQWQFRKKALESLFFGD